MAETDKGKTTMKIQNWAMVFNGNQYTAPETQSQSIVGNVYGHPTRPDGDSIRTSHIVEINMKKRYVKTHSGSKYYLGRMEPEYAKYLRELRKGKKQ